jgi:hypothetical protein
MSERPTVIPAKAELVGAGFKPALTPGFRVALAIASLPGMTPKLFKGFQEPDARLYRLAR